MSYANDNEMKSWGYAPLAAEADSSERMAFIRRTYLHVAGAILAFVVFEAALLITAPELIERSLSVAGRWTPLLLIGGFMVVSWIARSWAESSTSTAMQYAGLSLYVLAEAVIFAPLLYIAVYLTNDPSLLPSAAFITLFIFGGLTVITFVTRQDFSFLGSFLWWGGIAAFAIILAGIFFGFNLGWIFATAMILLASGYILYDTSNIIHHYRTDQHVAAALALFASVAVLFWWVLRLLMILNNRD
jgi:FtsH-binding integral membrane protein